MLANTSSAPGLDAAFRAREQVVLAGFLFRAAARSSHADSELSLCKSVCAALRMRLSIWDMG
ncbi:MAG: hypothetical protein EBU96_09525 [Actinobacteria bacterium]|nr:hypothetical protein [Actinomycetota bacterium]